MKNKYYVINQNGLVLDPEKYLKNSRCSNNFRLVIDREVFGKNVVRSIDNDEKAKYMEFAKKLGFNWEPNAPSGFMQNDYKAGLIMRLAKEYSRQIIHEIGFPIFEVAGSNMFDMEYPVVESYAGLYGNRLFQPRVGGKKSVMSYDASYPQFNLASKYRLSYRDLPFAHFSISDCYRQEQSGECMMLYRLRRFFMPDLHPYFRDVDDAFNWYPKIESQIIKSASEIGVDYEVIIAVSSDEAWEKYKDQIIEIAVRGKKDILISICQDEVPKYWIINVDYNLVDSLGQVREISCIQIDIGNAKRLGIEYVDEKGERKNPVIIHSAGIGGIERYLYMLFDKFDERFPIWLQPVQLRLIPVSAKFVPECLALAEKFGSKVRIDVDDRNESVGKRIKMAHVELIPSVLVMGEKELNSEIGLKSFHEQVKSIVQKSKGKPFIGIEWPRLVSRRVC